MIIAKIQRKKRSMSEKALEHFSDLSGGEDPNSFVDRVKGMKPNEAKEYILRNKKLFRILDEGGTDSRRPVVISDKRDELISHTRGFGEGVRPEDYLEEFKEFITGNINKIAALKAVCSKPRSLTRESLKSLKLELDRHNFTEKQLNTALKETKNEDIAADIISLIRQQAIGSALISHEDRIRSAVERLKEKHSFSKMEKNWIDRIERNLILESVLDKETFETGAFKTYGGFDKINKVFENKLDGIIDELNEYLYDDGGKIA